MFPTTNVFLRINKVDEIEVNSSGNEVTAANKIPPSKAPDSFVFLSNKST